jgi:hypothetical protein
VAPIDYTGAPSVGFCLRDTCRAMPEQSMTPDLVALTQGLFELGNRRDFDALSGVPAGLS